jgi:crotonobetainyl-CoA:carnitine CoA-transferase CaiB-like acyl-CoA transferase
MSNPVEDDLPLHGVRVLAVEQMYSLPFATQLMAYLGADVVKVEPPGTGELGRYDVLGVTDDDGLHVGYTYARNNLGKRSVCIDLGKPEGAELVRRLAGGFDVLASNFRPGVMEKLGLGYDDLRGLHPKLVYVSLSGFGTLNPTPYANRPGFAPIVEAMSGLYDYKNPPGTPPVVCPMGALGDLAPGVFSLVGILAALNKAQRTGRGSFVDVAMYDVMAAMADVVPGYWSLGSNPDDPENAAGVLAAFQARDGWFVVMALRDQHLKRLAEAVGHPEWLGDPRFAKRTGWNEHLEDVVRPAIHAWAAGRSKFDLCEELGAKGIAAGPCHNAGEVVADPHLKQHEMLVDVPRPDGGRPIIAMGNPIKFEGVAQRHLGRWPRLAEHTREILADELKLGNADIDALAQHGIIGLAKKDTRGEQQ